MTHTTRISFVSPVRTAHVVGRHRLRFLNAMTSMGLMKTEAGDARFATMSTATGKHLGQMHIEVENEALTLTAPAESFDRLLEGLKKHKVADDIRWTPAPEAVPVLAVWSSVGTEFQGLAAALETGDGIDVPGLGRWVDTMPGWAGGVKLRLSVYDAVFGELGDNVLYLRCDSPQPVTARTILDEAMKRIIASGVSPLPAETFATQRILALWPDDTRDLPEEEPTLASTRLVAAVDWNKGCFLGQEVFVMARDRGEAPKRLVALRGVGHPPEHGQEITTAAGQVAGRIGSAAADGSEGFVVLALMKRRFAADPTLRLGDGRPVTIASE